MLQYRTITYANTIAVFPTKVVYAILSPKSASRCCFPAELHHQLSYNKSCYFIGAEQAAI